MRAITFLFLIFSFFTAPVLAKCKCDSPESVLEYYLDAVQRADAQAIIDIYYGVTEFTVYKPVVLKEYKVQGKKILLEDKALTSLIDYGETPLWAKKDTVEMEVIQTWEGGLEERYLYSFRFVGKQWYMVAHSSENMPD